MPDLDIFEQDKDKPLEPATPVVEKPVQAPNYDQMLGMIVDGEGKSKYTTVDDALKGAAHAQAHIANLEQELAVLRSSESDSKKVEDLIATLQPKGEDDNQEPLKEQPKGLSPTEIQDLVKNAVKDLNTESTQDNNIKVVANKFRELYSDKASETLYSKANDLGMSKEDINSLIAKNPTAAFRVLGVEITAKPNIDVSTNSVNSENFQEKGKPEVKSSMGYLKTKDLTSNWLASKERTLARLNQ